MENTKPPPRSVSAILNAHGRGGIVSTPTAARQIAEVLIETHYGHAELLRQKPLSVKDEGDRWRVVGTANTNLRDEGTGPAVVVIWKEDGRILEIVVTKIHDFSDEIKNSEAFA